MNSVFFSSLPSLQLVLLVVVAVVGVFGEDKKSAKEDTKKAVEPATADKKQEKRGIFGEGYGHDFGGHDFGGHSYGGHHEISLGHDFHGHDFHGHDFGLDHGHHGHHEHHHEKTVTVVKKVPVPYPVEKHIPVPVEKVKHYPVHVHVPKVKTRFDRNLLGHTINELLRISSALSSRKNCSLSSQGNHKGSSSHSTTLSGWKGQTCTCSCACR